MKREGTKEKVAFPKNKKIQLPIVSRSIENLFKRKQHGVYLIVIARPV